MPSRRNRRLVNALRIFWVALIGWYELGIFYYSTSQCQWPDKKPHFDTSIPHDIRKSTRVLIVADPQILDLSSYPGRPAYLTLLSQVIVDLNLRKSWGAAVRLRPDVVIFLGDMMDNGRISMSDEEYEGYYKRFKHIFKMEPDVYQYYVPGNHDTGLGRSSLFSANARERYISHFGPLNHVQTIRGYTLVFLDAPGLAEEDYKRNGRGIGYNEWVPVRGGPVEFVHSFAQNQSTQPVILFSHIPLSRPEGTNCGPSREKGTIRRGVGLGYQNTLGKHSTQFLFENLRPSLIFSGDDHDYCEYTHILDGSTRVREVTVKSISMAMGIRRPGFQLLSLVQPDAPSSVNVPSMDAPCILPDQLGIYLSIYIPLATASLLVLLLCNLYNNRWFWFPQSLRWTAPRAIWDRPESDDDDGSLPAPALGAKKYNERHRRKFRLSAGSSWGLDSQVFPGRSGLTGSAGRRRHWRWAWGFMRDVRDVAALPLGVFVVVCFWMFR